MKIFRFILICLAFLFMGNLAAREKEDFDKFLKRTATVSKDLSSSKYYESVELSNKKTGEKKKFSELSELDQHIYKIMLAESFGQEMEELYNKWMDELVNAEDKPDDAKHASKQDVAEYMSQLNLLRKKNAERLESLVETTFKKWPDKFTEEEKAFILKSIRDQHNKHKLIKRG